MQKSEGGGIWTHNRWIWSPTLYRWSYALSSGILPFNLPINSISLHPYFLSFLKLHLYTNSYLCQSFAENSMKSQHVTFKFRIRDTTHYATANDGKEKIDRFTIMR